MNNPTRVGSSGFSMISAEAAVAGLVVAAPAAIGDLEAFAAVRGAHSAEPSTAENASCILT
jgi:hypothetical protein